MILLNFLHPLTAQQVSQLEHAADGKIDRVEEVQAHFDNDAPFGPQAASLADRCGLSAREWQTLPILVLPPALNVIAVLLLAELHGRMGHFPSCVRLRPVEASATTRYEVAEVLNLQAQRDQARQRRIREENIDETET